MNTDQCKSTHTVRGETMRCEGVEGHKSVHFSGSDWWPNIKGFPDHNEFKLVPTWLLALFILAAVALGLLFFVLL